MRVLLAALALAALPSCAILGGGFSAESAATDARAAAALTEAFSTSIRPTDPELADDLDSAVAMTRDVADALDAFAAGTTGRESVIEKADAALAFLQVVLDRADPDKAEELAPYIAAVRAVLTVATIYLPDEQ